MLMAIIDSRKGHASGPGDIHLISRLTHFAMLFAYLPKTIGNNICGDNASTVLGNETCFASHTVGDQGVNRAILVLL